MISYHEESAVILISFSCTSRPYRQDSSSTPLHLAFYLPPPHICPPSHNSFIKMSDPAYPAPSPFFDPYDKNGPIYTPLPTNFVPNLPSGKAPVRPVVSLWRQQCIAIMAGTIISILGALGLAANLRAGPLYDGFITVERYRGELINAVNVGVVIGALATLLGAMGRSVMAGVARAWLRRRAQGGQGITVRQWKTLAAGISIRDVRRTPFIGGGLILVFTVAIAGMNASLAGVAIPSAIYHITGRIISEVPYLRGNAFKGQLFSCLDKNKECAQNFNIGDIGSALNTRWANPQPGGFYSIYSLDYQSTGYSAALLPVSSPFTAYSITSKSPATTVSTSCVLASGVGVQGGQYRYTSVCPSTIGIRSYGNASDLNGSYITGVVCPAATSENAAILEIAAGGYEYSGAPSQTFAVKCTISAQEGPGSVALYPQYGLAEVVPPSASESRALSSNDVFLLGTGIVAAIAAEMGLSGVSGPLQLGLGKAVSSGVNLSTIERGISNGLAASAAGAYTRLNGTSDKVYLNQSSLLVQITEEGYGWAPDKRLLAWSIICILIGLIWLLLAAYMIGGGTRYDPTDWYQTLNTSAGSNLQQIPGTCTGAHLQPKKVNNQVLWYGELYPGHVGFAHQPTSQLQTKGKYGAVTAV